MVAPAVYAAQIYWQPSAFLAVENNSNLDLDTTGGKQVQGYLAGVATTVGISTPTSDTNIRPRFEYREYPKDKLDNRLEEYLDFNSAYRSLRSSANIFGSLEHRDEFNAELNSALYGDFNPVPPTSPQTGKPTVGATRDSASFFPSYAYRITPLLAAGVTAVYQHVAYSPINARNHVNFDYYLGRGFVSWKLNPKSELSFGGYGSEYQASRVHSRAGGTGQTLDLDNTWTQLFSTTVSVVYQRTQVDTEVPTPFHGVANAWGASVAAVYKARTSQFRLNGGRSITPSGGGSLYVIDQLQFQYDRNLNERLTFTGALVGLRQHGLTRNVSGADRKYVQSVIDLKWMLAPTWFLQGGFQYAWERYQFDLSGASNNRVYVRIGYQGLGRQQ